MEAKRNSLRCWYTGPARDATEAMPIGNGRLGALVFGGPAEERLLLNEETLWTGGPHENLNPAAGAALAKVRELLFAGRIAEAEKLIGTDMMGRPVMMQAFQPMGSLKLRFHGHEDPAFYERDLELRTGVARIRYRLGQAACTREMFASHPANVIVVHLASDSLGLLSFDACLDSPHAPARSQADGPATLRLAGRVGPTPEPESHSWTAPWSGETLAFECRLFVRAEGGTLEASGSELRVRDADRVTLLIAAATSYVNYRDISGDPAAACERSLSAARGKAYEVLRDQHVADFTELFDRSTLALETGHPEAADRPTDQRVKGIADGTDPQMAALYYHFGRYLLISSSRPGCQPATLQGIWNDLLWPYWGAKYTINVNIQMNYWPAEVTQLSECHEPLFDLMADLSETGGKVAREYYGAGGWMAHHNTDLWRLAAPVDGAGTYWQTGGAWLATHLFEHYLFTADLEFLRRAYPLMKGAAQFFVDALVTVPEGCPQAGRLVTSPSSSPEIGPTIDGKPAGRVTYGPTIDVEIIHHLFTQCIRAAGILGKDDVFVGRLANMLARLPPLQVGRHGQLQEWIGDWDNPEVPHHHISHLYAVYPGSQITPEDTPELAAAARRSLILRDVPYGGFPAVWRGACWARLGDSDRAYRYLAAYDGERSNSNLLGGLSQQDATYGVAALIAEMLVQSHRDAVELLPALPEAWPAGCVRGLCARGGYVVDLEWRDHRLTRAVVRARRDGRLRLRYGRRATELDVRPGIYTFDGELKLKEQNPEP